MSISKFWKVWNVGKIGKHAADVATSLGNSPVFGHAKGNKDDRSAHAVQDETSLTPAARRAGFSTAPRPKVGNAHGSHSVAATIRPPEVRVTAITRELFGGTLVIGLITEPLGFIQDAQDVMVLFDEWLAVLELCSSVRVLDEPSAGRDACMS